MILDVCTKDKKNHIKNSINASDHKIIVISISLQVSKGSQICLSKISISTVHGVYS